LKNRRFDFGFDLICFTLLQFWAMCAET
jgi:hypothetical protein